MSEKRGVETKRGRRQEGGEIDESGKDENEERGDMPANTFLSSLSVDPFGRMFVGG